MPASVICISHVEGAMGYEIGRLLAEQTERRFVDDGIITAAARGEGLLPEAVARAESRSAPRQVEVDFNRFERIDTVRTMIREAIAATADEGDVVIVAHAASYALAERDNVLRVLVTASDEIRQLRIAEDESIDVKAATKIRKESDKGRAAYIKSFYGVQRELPTHYDLVLNTDRLTLADAARAIAELAAAPA